MFSGVIEGFFGRVWGWQARHECVSFLAASGFDFYSYAPKADAFLRREWRRPIPATSAQEMTRLAAHCRDAGIAFGVGLSPFELYRDYDAAARADLRAKVRQIDSLGATLLFILFDDMRGDTPQLASLQARIMADITAWSGAARFVFCPTYYSSDPLLARVFGAPPAGYLEDIGRLLDARIDIFWTGEAVCSDCYTASHLTQVAQALRRKPFIWDNNIANDSKSRCTRLYLQPDAGRWALPRDLAAGIAINPMNQPALSRIALCGYRRLLGLADVADENDCFEACGAPLASLLRAGAPRWSTQGLESLDGAELARLRTAFAAHAGNRCAGEMLDWLDGGYRFDPACLTN